MWRIKDTLTSTTACRQVTAAADTAGQVRGDVTLPYDDRPLAAGRQRCRRRPRLAETQQGDVDLSSGRNVDKPRTGLQSNAGLECQEAG